MWAGSWPGFRNWVPKIGNCKLWGRPISQGKPQYTPILTINMYLLLEKGYGISIQWHGKCIDVKESTLRFEKVI